MNDRNGNTRCDKSVVVVGAGGNIGSHLLPHLARMPLVGRVTLIDRDVYEAGNLRSQAITPQDVGNPKAVVQARRLRRINPALRVEAVAEAVQHVPLGHLRGDLILACLDSREARRHVNQSAWRLGVPWVDAGVETGGLLARVGAFVPTPDAPCLECAWDDQDYALQEQRYPCRGKSSEPLPTNAPSSLGALAASLQAIECHKLLAGQFDRAAVGQQVLIDAAYHKHYVTRMLRNPHCRFDHEVWSIGKVKAGANELTVAQALGLTDKAVEGNCSPALWIEGKAFVRATVCSGCGHERNTLRLQGRLRRADQTCVRCGGEMVPVGFEMLDGLNARSVSKRLLARSLSSLGLRSGDVYSIRVARGESRHHEIGRDQM